MMTRVRSRMRDQNRIRLCHNRWTAKSRSVAVLVSVACSCVLMVHCTTNERSSRRAGSQEAERVSDAMAATELADGQPATPPAAVPAGADDGDTPPLLRPLRPWQPEPLRIAADAACVYIDYENGDDARGRPVVWLSDGSDTFAATSTQALEPR